jgi:hypothetical protein
MQTIILLQGDNWLGVARAALMRIPKERMAWLVPFFSPPVIPGLS